MPQAASLCLACAAQTFVRQYKVKITEKSAGRLQQQEVEAKKVSGKGV